MKVLKKLNDNQLKAVKSDSKYILCFASAGSGKTTVLTNRASYLNEVKRVGTNNMLCLTFTRLAGKEMKERLVKLIGREGENIFSNTFHAFCVMILKTYGRYIGLKEEFTIYDEDDKTSIINSIIDDLNIKEVCNERFLSDINECLQHPEYKKEDYPGLVKAITVCNEYRYRLRDNSAVDLDMLLTNTLKLFKQESAVKEYYHQQYQYVFVDEFQDTNNVQMDIIKEINPQNLFVVGDDDQSIYGWRGAEPKYILDFKNEYPECEVIKLEENYRSTSQIITVANNLIKKNKDREDKKMKAFKDGTDIEYFTAQNFEEETYLIGKKILNSSEDYGNYAILARNNYQVDECAKTLNSMNIKCRMINNKKDIFKSYTIRPIINFIDAAININDNRAVKSAVNYPFARLTKEQIEKLELKCIEKDKYIYEGIKEFKFKESEKIIDFTIKIENIQSKLRTCDSAFEVFNYVVDALDIKSIYNSQDRINRNKDIEMAMAKIQKWEGIQKNLNEETDMPAFLKYIRIKDIQDKMLEEETGAVKLMTIHASKGLEFNNVFLIGMNQNIFPNRRGNIEEERRLCYVAVTRAKEKLYISRAEKIRYVTGLEVNTDESQFIKELGIN